MQFILSFLEITPACIQYFSISNFTAAGTGRGWVYCDVNVVYLSHLANYCDVFILWQDARNMCTQKMKKFSNKILKSYSYACVNNVIKVLKSNNVCRSKPKQYHNWWFNWLMIVQFFDCCWIIIVKKCLYVIIKSLQMINVFFNSACVKQWRLTA